MWSDYDETIAHRPPFHVLVNDNNSKPVFSHTPPAGPSTGDSVNLIDHSSAINSKIKSVHVFYKIMPAYYEWVPIEMHGAGDGNYSATVPLTHEGILYYFDALDEDGNGANYPNFMEQTPYLVIDSRDAANRAPIDLGQSKREHDKNENQRCPHYSSFCSPKSAHRGLHSRAASHPMDLVDVFTDNGSWAMPSCSLLITALSCYGELLIPN